MKRITISAQILDGNLGDGWRDNYEVACALAYFSRAIWEKDLADFVADGYETSFVIDVERNTSGCSREMCVEIDGAELDMDEVWDIKHSVEMCITTEDRIWEMFCESEFATEYFAEV